MRYLTVNNIIDFNRNVILRTGGLRDAAGSVHNPNSLQHVVQIVQNDGYYGTIAAKAAVYAFNIIRGHVFVDGNKRTGMGAAMVFLLQNGCLASITNEDVEVCALAIAQGTVTRAELVRWFEDRIS